MKVNLCDWLLLTVPGWLLVLALTVCLFAAPKSPVVVVLIAWGFVGAVTVSAYMDSTRPPLSVMHFFCSQS